MKRAQFIFMLALWLLDIGAVWLGFWSAHSILQSNPEFVLGPFVEFWPLPALYTVHRRR